MPEQYVSFSAVAWPAIEPGTQDQRSGTMSRSQAVIIGVVILIVALGVFGLTALSERVP